MDVKQPRLALVELSATGGGAVLGWLLAGAFRASSNSEARGRHLQQSARRIGRLVHRVAGDVGEHQARIDEVSRRLDACRSPEGALLTEVVVGAISQFVESNSHLQARLCEAEKKLERQADQIQRQIKEARTDPLTELPNRREFRDQLDRLVAMRARKQIVFSAVLLDLDHFKGINDRYGHGAGDHVLRATSQVIRSSLRPNDLAARVGEEFALVLPARASRRPAALPNDCATAMAAETFHLDDHPLRTTISLGVAEAGPHEHALGIMKRADEALYAAKAAGRDCAFFHDGRQIRPITATTAAGTTEAATGGPCSQSAGQALSDAPGPENRGIDPDFPALCRRLRERLEAVVGG